MTASKPIPYTYVVTTRRRCARERFALSVLTAKGYQLLDTHKRLSVAVSTARLLAGKNGAVEVRV